MRDLIVLTADKNMQFALRGTLRRADALQIRPIDFDFRVHAGRDGGVRSSGADVLRSERRRFNRALLVLDFEGCGARPGQASIEIETQLDNDLAAVWGLDAKAIVIEPELEAWVWGSDNALQNALDWPLQQSVRDWLAQNGHAIGSDGKPAQPKAAFEALVPVHRVPRSSAVYESITGRISLARCHDAAFLRLKQTLQRWFPKAVAA